MKWYGKRMSTNIEDHTYYEDPPPLKSYSKPRGEALQRKLEAGSANSGVTPLEQAGKLQRTRLRRIYHGRMGD